MIVVIEDTTRNPATPDLIHEHFPMVEPRRPLGGRTSLMDISAALR